VLFRSQLFTPFVLGKKVEMVRRELFCCFGRGERLMYHSKIKPNGKDVF